MAGDDTPVDSDAQIGGIVGNALGGALVLAPPGLDLFDDARCCRGTAVVGRRGAAVGPSCLDVSTGWPTSKRTRAKCLSRQLRAQSAGSGTDSRAGVDLLKSAEHWRTSLGSLHVQYPRVIMHQMDSNTRSAGAVSVVAAHAGPKLLELSSTTAPNSGPVTAPMLRAAVA